MSEHLQKETRDDAVLSLRNVTMRFGGVTALNEVNIDLYPGEILALIGPNGAGKTTLLKLLAGPIQPDTGSIQFSFDSKTALVLHHTPMIKASARANLGLVRDVDSSITDKDIDLALKQVGLNELAQSPAHKLSAGERQKLCLARAILQKPNLVLLDEPTANLDPNTAEQVEEMIRQFDQSGTDLLFSSHQLAQVQRLAEYILFIDQGEIKEKGPVGPFFLNPQTAAAKRYLQQELIAD